MTDQNRAAVRDGSTMQAECDAVVESCLVALGEHSTERLRRVLREAQDRNPDGWLALMLFEYLDTWR
jgi:hypothetical protein